MKIYHLNDPEDKDRFINLCDHRRDNVSAQQSKIESFTEQKTTHFSRFEGDSVG